MTTHATRASAPVMLVLALAWGLAGCASSSSDDEPAASSPVVQETAATEPTEAADVTSDDQTAALDAYVAAAQAGIPTILQSGAGAYTEVRITAVHPTTLSYEYVYAEPVDAAASSSYFDTMLATLQGVCDSSVFPEMVSAGVTDPKVTYSYYNPDGSQIWTHEFVPS